MAITQPHAVLSRDDLLKMHTHYHGLIIQNLDFCYKYFNFYIGLLSALVAATIAGLLQLTQPSPRGLLLLIGPALVIVLAVLGYQTVQVFYRRFIEASITGLNIDAMLGIRDALELGPGVRAPLFTSQVHATFIAEFERPHVRKVLEQAEHKHWPAEQLLDCLVPTGDTLRYAWRTFAVFVGTALWLALAVLLVVG